MHVLGMKGTKRAQTLLNVVVDVNCDWPDELSAATVASSSGAFCVRWCVSATAATMSGSTIAEV